MCSGKTTLGKELATRLNVDFIDLDEYIEHRAGCTISEIFATDGEDAFRRLESDSLAQVIERYGDHTVVMALGGGTPCRPGVMERLNEVGVTVHLDVPVWRFVERLVEGASKRPLVAGKSKDELADYVKSMLDLRNPYYTQALLRFDASQLETAEQVKKSAELLQDILKQI